MIIELQHKTLQFNKVYYWENVLSNYTIVPGTADMCSCMPVSQCSDYNAITYAGIGILDPRFGPCQSSSLVCCRLLQSGRADLNIDTSGGKNIVNPDPEPGAPTPACGLKDRTYFRGIK